MTNLPAGRHGATLLEVLVAIFVMAIGLMALLTLFPLGVLTMMQAIQDERVAEAAANATCLAQAVNLRQDSSVVPLLKNPNPAVFLDAPVLQAGAHPPPPSYPVMVDPVGFNNYLGPWNQWVGGLSTGGIPRTSLSFLQAPQLTVKMLQFGTLLDDLAFDQNGLPASPTARDGQYSWSYLVQRPHFLDTSVVDLTVIVYSQRPLGLPGPTGINFLQPDETQYSAVFDTTVNQVKVSWTATQVAPAVNVGNWILDSTPVPVQPTPPTPPQYGPPHARFYRVVGVTETGVNSLSLELQTSIIVTPPFVANSSSPTTNTGTVIVIGGIVDVFQKGDGWRP